MFLRIQLQLMRKLANRLGQIGRLSSAAARRERLVIFKLCHAHFMFVLSLSSQLERCKTGSIAIHFWMVETFSQAGNFLASGRGLIE